MGGVRAKVLAAERAGLSEVHPPRANLPEVPKGTKLTIVGVECWPTCCAMRSLGECSAAVSSGRVDELSSRHAEQG